MTLTTRRLGYIAFGVTEIIIVVGIVLQPTKIVEIIGLQTAVFCTVWGAVGVKNFIDMKKDINDAQK
jgi:hypothetical protein